MCLPGRPQPNQAYTNFVNRCLQEKGYEVSGWQWRTGAEGLLARGTRGLRRPSFDARSRGLLLPASSDGERGISEKMALNEGAQ